MNKNLDKLLGFILVLVFLLKSFNLTNSKFGLYLLIFTALVGTLPVILSSITALKNRKISVDLLAAIALVASLILREWFSAIFINLMLVFARLLDYYSENKAHSAINSLLKLRPQKVRVKNGDKIEDKNADEVKVGDLVVIESGDRVPVDGIIEKGEASIDRSSLTGESLPVTKREGGEVLSSTLVISGSLVVRAEKIGRDTTFEKIVDLVEGAHQAKPKINSIAERFATLYIVSVVVGAALIYMFSRNLALLLSVLLVACADDIAVAIPIAFLISIGNAAKNGIIIKGGDFLESMAKVKTIIFDKTGTLTLGRLSVEKVIPFGGNSSEDVVRLAATSDFFSKHVSARAVIDYAEKENIKFKKPESFQEFPGSGSTADFDGDKIYTGKVDFLKKNGIVIKDSDLKEIIALENQGLNITLVGFRSGLVGVVGLSDKVRPGVKETILKLKESGVSHWVMLTGDNEDVAKKIAIQVGINEYHANLLPENKLDFIKKHLSKKSKLAMVGDGVNDAAALALADVGIAMGVIGSDAAIEAADIALMRDDFSKIPDIINLGKKTMKVAYQDFWIWGIINILGLVLIFTHQIGPQGAAAYNFLTDFLPLLNSATLFRKFS